MTERGAVVDVEWAAILRRLNANGGDGVFIVVKADRAGGDNEGLNHAVRVSVDGANDHLASGRPEGPVVGHGPQESMSGPVVDLHHIGSDEEVRAWLAAFASGLEAAGLRGRVTAAAQAWLPKSFDPLARSAKMTAFLRFSMQVPLPPHGPAMWLVNRAVTRRLAAFALEWGQELGPDRVYVVQGSSSLRFTTPPSLDRVEQIIRHRFAGLQFVTSKPQAVRHFGSLDFGEAAFSTAGEPGGWRADLDRVRDTMTRFAADLDVAAIARRPGVFDNGWGNIGSLQPRPPISEAMWRMNRHMWSRYVIDAFGSQVLTRRHLDRAHDLSRWEVSDLGDDRFLVEHRDIEAWYANDAPEQAVVEQARIDFGPMLLTEDAIAADPDGWWSTLGRSQRTWSADQVVAYEPG